MLKEIWEGSKPGSSAPGAIRNIWEQSAGARQGKQRGAFTRSRHFPGFQLLRRGICWNSGLTWSRTSWQPHVLHQIKAGKGPAALADPKPPLGKHQKGAQPLFPFPCPSRGLESSRTDPKMIFWDEGWDREAKKGWSGDAPQGLTQASGDFLDFQLLGWFLSAPLRDKGSQLINSAPRFQSSFCSGPEWYSRVFSLLDSPALLHGKPNKDGLESQNPRMAGTGP